MDIIKNIGSILGYQLTAFSLIALFKTKFFGLIKRESGKDKIYEEFDKINDKLACLEKRLAEDVAKENDFIQKIHEQLNYQNDASRQLLADAIENLYRRHIVDKTLDETEFKKLINAYSIYHNELCGNSYITKIYDEMVENWNHN